MVDVYDYGWIRVLVIGDDDSDDGLCKFRWLIRWVLGADTTTKDGWWWWAKWVYNFWWMIKPQ